ncbi:hypothetical protein LTR78_010564 [Recurvomyces mirabilis]|uniref:Uncharacterized protein n=1 Tax=Recurvomyces mirabilis TaxID=574656 RepID=A0AAE0WG63_9PEZI|nr:hypothetical protein LTR78_010564 [Recurvomyces mirabilis]KAK5160792.1 hypothetical protein LTS14_001805 [Recurvomyces mirabilis]
MPLFGFLTRRRSSNRVSGRAPLDEKIPPMPTQATAIDRKSSKRSKRRASAQLEKSAEARPPMPQRKSTPIDKESRTPMRKGSIENITALPVSNKLATSPHLRPADLDRPHIPYNFRPYSMSQGSVQGQDMSFSRPQTLRSRASGTPSRRPSSKRKSKQVREEEIRAMSSPIPIPKRPGEGPLRRDSKKIRRGLGGLGSNVSLPFEESVHSSMSGARDQRGWEVGILDVFNPRPAVRLSGVPQGVTSMSAPGTSYMSPSSSKRNKDKMPVSRGSARKPDIIGEAADDLDASDIRMLMEREKKRKDKRDKERQEKLDRKLRSRNGRNRGDSDRKTREAEEQKGKDEVQMVADEGARRRALEEAERRAEEERRTREALQPPIAIHPALRDQPAVSEVETIGLGIGAGALRGHEISEHEQAHALPTTEELGTENTGTYLHYDTAEAIPANVDDVPTNPFADPVSTPQAVEVETDPLRTGARSFSPMATPLETPLEEPALPKAQAAMSVTQQITPPLSPIRTNQTERAPSSLSQVQTPDMPEPLIMPTDRRTSEPKDKRAGAWASFFRRGGTNFRRPGEDGRSSGSTSFSNISRESMRNQPIPAHLIDTQLPTPSARRKSGTPTRTQSKFREDLPEMPVSPPDSRMPSPDVTQAAALAAAARRGKRVPKPVDIPGARTETPDLPTVNRNDTPVSPSRRGHNQMSASMASVDSEGSWLASTGKRQSTQSALSRSMGSLRQRRQDFSESYEELPGDRDAEYVAHTGPAERSQMSPSALAGASPDEESVRDVEVAGAGSSADPLTMHGSVRRNPTLVHRDPRVKSREGLLTEYETVTTPDEPESPTSIYNDEFDLAETRGAQIQSAKSVNYGRSHARQVSAGSAKLLDLPPKRQSMDAVSGAPGSPRASLTPAARSTQQL